MRKLKPHSFGLKIQMFGKFPSFAYFFPPFGIGKVPVDGFRKRGFNFVFWLPSYVGF